MFKPFVMHFYWRDGMIHISLQNLRLYLQNPQEKLIHYKTSISEPKEDPRSQTPKYCFEPYFQEAVTLTQNIWASFFYESLIIFLPSFDSRLITLLERRGRRSLLIPCMSRLVCTNNCVVPPIERFLRATWWGVWCQDRRCETYRFKSNSSMQVYSIAINREKNQNVILKLYRLINWVNYRRTSRGQDW